MQHHGMENKIRRYLLGDISNEERQEIERQMMTEGDFFEQVALSEEALIDDYVRGALPTDEREKFEHSFFSTPEGTQKVRLVAILSKYASSVKAVQESTKRFSILDYLRSSIPMPGYVIVATTTGFVLIATVLLTSMLRLQSQIDQLHAQQGDANQPYLREQLAEQQTRNQELLEQLKREREKRVGLEQELIALKNLKDPDGPQRNFVALVLMPGRTRGTGKIKRLVIKTGVEQAFFHLVLREDDYPLYEVTLHTESGEEVWSKISLKAQANGAHKEIRVTIPASILANGNYFLQMQGTVSQSDREDIGKYYFQVVKK